MPPHGLNLGTHCPLIWTAKNLRLRVNENLSFGRYPFNAEILREGRSPAPLGTMKSAQCGGTTNAIMECLFHASERGRSALYYVPTKVTVGPIVREKADPLILASPYIRARAWEARSHRDRVENIHQKSIGPGWIYFLGAKSRLAREATPGDLVVCDERDHFEASWIDDIKQRLNDSDYKGWREIGKPTFINGPIHRFYKASDQRVWMVRCPHCRDLASLDWDRDVVVKEGPGSASLRDRKWSRGSGRDIHIYCPKCGKPRDRLATGGWVAKHPGREARGFSINRLMTYSASIEELWGLYREALESGDQSKMQSVMNGHFGQPYTPESAGLSDELLDACMRNYRMPEKISEEDAICTGGFDVQGDYLVGRISQVIGSGPDRIRRAVWIGRVDWDHIDELFSRFPMKMVVIDGAYDPTAAKKCRINNPFVWLGFYPSMDNPKRAPLDPDRNDRSVLIQRTQSLDRSHGELLTEHNHLPRTADAIPAYYDEMKAAVRVEEETPRGQKYFAWRKTGDDDYRHADNYDLVAADLLAQGYASGPAAVRGESRRAEALTKIHRKPSGESDTEIRQWLEKGKGQEDSKK